MCFPRRVVGRITIRIGEHWSASSQACEALDAVLSTLNTDSHAAVKVKVEWRFFIVTRTSFSQTCMEGYTREILPRCAAKGLLDPCHGGWGGCGVHDLYSHPQAYFSGTMQDLLNMLPRWTLTVAYGHIKIQPTPLESLKPLSQETLSLWQEISRIFSLSISSAQQSKIEVCLSSIGTIVFDHFKGMLTMPSAFGPGDEVVLFQTAIQSDMPYGLPSRMRTTTRSLTYLIFYHACIRALFPTSTLRSKAVGLPALEHGTRSTRLFLL